MIRKHSVCAFVALYTKKIEFAFILKSEFKDLMFQEIEEKFLEIK